MVVRAESSWLRKELLSTQTTLGRAGTEPRRPNSLLNARSSADPTDCFLARGLFPIAAVYHVPPRQKKPPQTEATQRAYGIKGHSPEIVLILEMVSRRKPS
jgi:hypothetical protein